MGWSNFCAVVVVDLILAMVVCCGLRLVMGFEGGCGDYWWTGERGTTERDKFGHFDKDVKRWRKSFGSLVNSFYELEPTYVDYIRKEMGKKVWLVGLASCNTNVIDKAEK